jgi:hypothetical protein
VESYFILSPLHISPFPPLLYVRAGSSITVIVNILFDGENTSFDASLVIYINSTNIPPIMIMNRICENQNLLYIVPLMIQTIMVCMSSISPTARGCFICVNINLVILIDISRFVMSGGILFKMLVLGINEMVFYLSTEVLKGCILIFYLQDQYFY